MGRLMHIEDIKREGLMWYFDKWVTSLPNDRFPAQCAIPYDKMFGERDDTHAHSIEIRQWVEREINETVLYRMVDLSYSTEGLWQIKHGYVRFFFESEETALMFRLKFSELIVSVMYKFVEGEWPTWMKVRGDCANVVIDPNEPFKI